MSGNDGGRREDEELNDISPFSTAGSVPPPSANPLDAIMAAGTPGAGRSPSFGAQQSPQYLRYNTRGRAWHERMFANAGMMYLSGISAGGLYGALHGLRNSPSPRFRVRLNTFLNSCARYGSRSGNALGVLAVLFSLFESGLDYVDLDRYVPGNYSATPALAGMATGALYKSRNPRTAVLASVAGGGAAAAYSAYGHYIPSPLSLIF